MIYPGFKFFESSHVKNFIKNVRLKESEKKDLEKFNRMA